MKIVINKLFQFLRLAPLSGIFITREFTINLWIIYKSCIKLTALIDEMGNSSIFKYVVEKLAMQSEEIR